MVRKNRLGILGASAMALASLLSAAPSPNVATIGETTTQNASNPKEVVPVPIRPVRAMPRRYESGFRAHKEGSANRFLNQRQYRKRCRQAPHLYKSKKHRSKN